jgi:hypothetical protein
MIIEIRGRPSMSKKKTVRVVLGFFSGVPHGAVMVLIEDGVDHVA